MSTLPPQTLIDRIARAISRIDQAGARPAAPSPGNTQLNALEARHAKLRAESAAALAELDALIGRETR